MRRVVGLALRSPVALAVLVFLVATGAMFMHEGRRTTAGDGSINPAFAGTNITLSANADGQTLTGWEITPRFWEFAKAKDRYDGTWLASRDAIVDKLVTDAGITRVRIEVRSGVKNPVDYWTPFITGKIGYNEVKRHFYEKIGKDDPATGANGQAYNWASFDYYVENFVLPLREKLAQHNLPLYINLCFVDFKWTPLKGNLSLADHPTAYAQLMTQAALRLRDRYHLTTDAVEIILEPDNTDGWTGKAIGQGLVALNTALAQEGLHPKFIVPSPSKAIRTAGYIDDILKVKGASGLVNVIAYHRYEGSLLADTSLDGIRSRAKALGADTAMLEYVDASTHDFFRDMEYGGASAWQSYAAAYAALNADAVGNGAALWRDDHGQVALTPQFRTIGLVQRSIRPGARAQAVSLSNTQDMALAFRNPDGSTVLAVYSPKGSLFRLPQATGVFTLNTTTNRADVETHTLTPDKQNRLTFSIAAGQVGVLRALPPVHG